jgi:hypothetical protein
VALVKKKELISSLKHAPICIAEPVEQIEVANIASRRHFSYNLDAARVR